jgi:hypothetical protein
MRNFIISETQGQHNSRSNNAQSEQTSPQNNQNKGETTDTFPPFDVLLTWLRYTYSQTGKWPLPPEDLQSGQANFQDTPPDKAYNIRERQNEQLIEVKNTGTSETRSKGLWIVPGTSTPQKIKAEYKVQGCSTNFDYVNSCYFTEASRLIDNFAKQTIQADLLFGCKRVLSLIIAWCHFPLFNGLSKRQGRWMVLATVHCSHELRMRVAYFRECVEELEAAGLIVTGQAGNGMLERYAFEQLRYDCTNLEELLGSEATKYYWSRQSVQTKTLVYRLAEEVELDKTLATFNPFISGKDERINLVEDRERPKREPKTEITPGKDLAKNRKDREIQITNATTVSGSFPGVPCYESIHDDNDKAVNLFSNVEPVKEICAVVDATLTSNTEPILKSFSNPDSEQLGKLTSEQRAKFDFLNNNAAFEGYCRKDGRATLDTQEAVKFALMPNLTLEILQLRYNQVGEMWANGHCNRNPIGLLHWAIVNNCDPRGYDDQEKPPSKNQNVKSPSIETASSTTHSNSALSTKAYSKSGRSGSSYRSRSDYWRDRSQNSIERKRVRNSSQSFSPFQSLTEVSVTTEELEIIEDEESETILNAMPVQTPNYLEDPVTLWRDIVDCDLAGRFKLSSRELDLLVSSRLELNIGGAEDSEKRLRVVLRSIFEENQLELTTRNVIQLAIRQKLGPGYKLSFTSAP